MHRLARIALLVVASSCAGGDPERPRDSGVAPGDGEAAPVLHLGEGQAMFRAIGDGDTLLLARGCQGGQHVWITLRSEHLNPAGPIVQLSLSRVSDGAVVSDPLRLLISFSPRSGFAELSGLILPVPDPDAAIGQDLILRGRVEDREGDEAVAERRVRVRWGTEICGG